MEKSKNEIALSSYGEIVLCTRDTGVEGKIVERDETEVSREPL